MRKISFDTQESLWDVSATRDLEDAARGSLPPHELMSRAGTAIARLTDALAPHAQTLWIACGPGNNGGDGLTAATLLHNHDQERGSKRRICLTLSGDPDNLPPDASNALQNALNSGLTLSNQPPDQYDFALDALLGIGASRTPEGKLAQTVSRLRSSHSPVLAVDVPSGLMADTGVLLGAAAPAAAPRYTLSLLTLKPGLFTAHGRDSAGEIWFDDLGVGKDSSRPPTALLYVPTPDVAQMARPHISHKGTFGDVLVIGGQGAGANGVAMCGAAVLAARAAVRSGAGRVYLSLLEGGLPGDFFDPQQPEIMFRTVAAAHRDKLMGRSAVVCGCGGGDAVTAELPAVLSDAQTLVLDADALNAISADARLQARLTDRQAGSATTVITPHPLEAARLLGCSTEQIMRDRVLASTELSQRFGVICVLKGSGTVVTAPGKRPSINASGNAALATAGTGDVLAGMLGAALAQCSNGQDAHLATLNGVFEHGHLADKWIRAHGNRPLTADWLTRQGELTSLAHG